MGKKRTLDIKGLTMAMAIPATLAVATGVKECTSPERKFVKYVHQNAIELIDKQPSAEYLANTKNIPTNYSDDKKQLRADSAKYADAIRYNMTSKSAYFCDEINLTFYPLRETAEIQGFVG